MLLEGFFYKDRPALIPTATLRIAARRALKIVSAVWCRNAPGCGLRMEGPARIVVLLRQLKIEERSGR
jgi:hypothetical protein